MISQEEFDSIVPGCKIKIFSNSVCTVDTKSSDSVTAKEMSPRNYSFKKNDIREVLFWPIPEVFISEHIGGTIETRYGKFTIKHLTMDSSMVETLTGHKIRRSDIITYKPPLKKSVVPISDEEFADLKPGDRLVIAPKDYIESKCDAEGRYSGRTYVAGKFHELTTHYGKDTAIVNDIEFDQIYIKNAFYIKVRLHIHRDFVIGVIKTTTSCISQEEYDSLQIGDWVETVSVEEASKHTLSIGGQYKYNIRHCFNAHLLNEICSHFKRIEYTTPIPKIKTESDSFCFIPREFIKRKLKSTLVDLELFSGNVVEEVSLDIEQEIKMKTVEEIKALGADNLKEVSAQVFESKNEAAVEEGKKILTSLLAEQKMLAERKATTDKALAEVEEKIKAFGYPPK